MDIIHLTGIRGYGYVGALPEEQVLGQWFEVNVTLKLNLATAGQSDRLEDTLNYCSVVETVQHLIQTSKFALLEKLASAIADAILQNNAETLIHQVTIALTKLTPPIPNFSGQVTIEITRKPFNT
ncbi:MAG: dihydroneopterin aldolase [Leptolyngbyaceae cyanobacterium CAN_BIN12]|nr:dihydroneopterin aldolase [Leptolyngbyaceae cyanobacterium CAN_BIN12]